MQDAASASGSSLADRDRPQQLGNVMTACISKDRCSLAQIVDIVAVDDLVAYLVVGGVSWEDWPKRSGKRADELYRTWQATQQAESLDPSETIKTLRSIFDRVGCSALGIPYEVIKNMLNKWQGYVGQKSFIIRPQPDCSGSTLHTSVVALKQVAIPSNQQRQMAGFHSMGCSTSETVVMLENEGLSWECMFRTMDDGSLRIRLGPGARFRRSCDHCFSASTYDAPDGVFSSPTYQVWTAEPGQEVFLQGGRAFDASLCREAAHDFNVTNYVLNEPGKDIIPFIHNFPLIPAVARLDDVCDDVIPKLATKQGGIADQKVVKGGKTTALTGGPLPSSTLEELPSAPLQLPSTDFEAPHPVKTKRAGRDGTPPRTKRPKVRKVRRVIESDDEREDARKAEEVAPPVTADLPMDPAENRDVKPAVGVLAPGPDYTLDALDGYTKDGMEVEEGQGDTQESGAEECLISNKAERHGPEVEVTVDILPSAGDNEPVAAGADQAYDLPSEDNTHEARPKSSVSPEEPASREPGGIQAERKELPLVKEENLDDPATIVPVAGTAYREAIDALQDELDDMTRKDADSQRELQDIRMALQVCQAESAAAQAGRNWEAQRATKAEEALAMAQVCLGERARELAILKEEVQVANKLVQKTQAELVRADQSHEQETARLDAFHENATADLNSTITMLQRENADLRKEAAEHRKADQLSTHFRRNLAEKLNRSQKEQKEMEEKLKKLEEKLKKLEEKLGDTAGMWATWTKEKHDLKRGHQSEIAELNEHWSRARAKEIAAWQATFAREQQQRKECEQAAGKLSRRLDLAQKELDTHRSNYGASEGTDVAMLKQRSDNQAAEIKKLTEANRKANNALEQLRQEWIAADHLQLGTPPGVGRPIPAVSLPPTPTSTAPPIGQEEPHLGSASAGPSAHPSQSGRRVFYHHPASASSRSMSTTPVVPSQLNPSQRQVSASSTPRRVVSGSLPPMSAGSAPHGTPMMPVQAVNLQMMQLGSYSSVPSPGAMTGHEAHHYQMVRQYHQMGHTAAQYGDPYMYWAAVQPPALPPAPPHVMTQQNTTIPPGYSQPHMPTQSPHPAAGQNTHSRAQSIPAFAQGPLPAPPRPTTPAAAVKPLPPTET